jgi:hypothetical protein
MIKIYIFNKINKISPFIIFADSDSRGDKKLFQNVKIDNIESLSTIVTNPIDADIFAIPHNFFSIKNNKEYIDECIKLSSKYSKKILVFAYGDSSEVINIPNSIVVRTSQYRSNKKDNEIIMPAYVEDLGAKGVVLKEKNNIKPVIGFVGWSGFKRNIDMIKFNLKIYLNIILITFGKVKVPQLQGLFFRIKLIKFLSKSVLIDTNFIIRKSYSGHSKVIEISPEKAREEFISVINNSDFSLAVKGDGNYSLRFFEILSLAKIPLFIDTDCCLPLEDDINYDDFIFRVDYKSIKNVDRIIRDFYSSISEEKFLEMQRKARITFEEKLSIQSFMKILFDKLNYIYAKK